MPPVATADINDVIDAPIEDVWSIVSDFVGMIEKMGSPVQGKGEGIGMTRTIDGKRGRIIERLDAIDPSVHSVSYSIVEAPLPFAHYEARITLTDSGDGRTRIRWCCTFEPIGSEGAAVKLCVSIYEGAIVSLKRIVAT